MVARLATAGLLGVLLAAAFSPILFEGRTLSSAAWLPGVLPSGPVDAGRPPGSPPVRDIEGASWVDEPAPYLVHRSLAAGHLPLWNDAEGLGLPLLGNPNMGALSPLQLPVNLFPSAWLQDLVWLGRALLLGVFTFGLARTLGSRWAGAFAAAAALMLSGQTVEWIEHHPLNTDVFVPATLWAALAASRTGRRGVGWLALAVAAGLLGVKPQSAVLAGIFGVFLLVAAYADRAVEARPSLPRALVACVAGVLLGVGVAAVALLPFRVTWDQASGLVRAARTTQSEWTLPAERLSSLGGALAVKMQHLPSGGESRGTDAAPGLPYAGLSVIVGAALGFWSTRQSWVSRVLAVTALALLLRAHGLLPIPLGDVPILGSINFVKYCFPLYLAIALLLARAIDSLPGPVAAVGVALVVAELLWLVPRNWAERVDPYAPAPWVGELRRLTGAHPGRMSGPVELAPPLVSAALGFRDLRSIDVLTPRDAYDFVSRLVAPSRGVTWILADPDPLLAATGPGANLADLRWIVAARPLAAADLPAAVRAATTSRRLVRLFDDLEHQAIETRTLGGGIHGGGGDRRFHWTCETPCRFAFRLRRVPEYFVAGLAAPAPVAVRMRLEVEGAEAVSSEVPAGAAWRDLWLQTRVAAGRPGAIVLDIDSETPAPVFVGGVGPAPAPAVESSLEGRELAFRAEALGRLRLRWNDDVAYLYENADAMGEASFARRVVSVPDRDGALSCVARAPGEIVACVPRDQIAARDLPRPGPGRVEVTRSDPGRLQVATEAGAPRLLVVSRLFAPGWHARIDGQGAPLRRVNAALMALEIPAGAHEVVIEYASPGFGLGIGVSLACLLAIGALLWSGRGLAGRV